MPDKVSYETIEISLWVLMILCFIITWVIKGIRTKEWMPFCQEYKYSIIGGLFIPVALVITILGILCFLFKGLVYFIHYLTTT